MKLKMLLITTLVSIMTLLPIGLQAAGLSIGLEATTAYQYTNTVSCQGRFWGYQATITGWHQYAPYNALGDGTVWFVGEMQIGQGKFPMTYDGYTRLAPYVGILQVGQQNYAFKILDNTGGRMIIYEGRERLTAPAIWGEFVCSWQAYAPPASSSSSRNSSSQRGGESYYGEYGSVLRDENCTFVIVDGASIGGCE